MERIVAFILDYAAYLINRLSHGTDGKVVILIESPETLFSGIAVTRDGDIFFTVWNQK